MYSIVMFSLSVVRLLFLKLYDVSWCFLIISLYYTFSRYCMIYYDVFSLYSLLFLRTVWCIIFFLHIILFLEIVFWKTASRINSFCIKGYVLTMFIYFVISKNCMMCSFSAVCCFKELYDGVPFCCYTTQPTTRDRCRWNRSNVGNFRG